MTLYAVQAWGAAHGIRASVRRARPAAIDPGSPWFLDVDGDLTALAAVNERQAWREAWTLIQATPTPRTPTPTVGEQLSLLAGAA